MFAPATGVRRGLATRETLIGMSLERLGESIARGKPASDFIIVQQLLIVVGLRFK
jgi:hypothetical protein